MNSDPSPNPYPNRNNPNNLLDTIILLDTNSDRVILRKFDHSKHSSLFCDGICQNVSFQKIMNENFCMKNLLLDVLVYVVKCVFC